MVDPMRLGHTTDCTLACTIAIRGLPIGTPRIIPFMALLLDPCVWNHEVAHHGVRDRIAGPEPNSDRVRGPV